jgi:hypothetical protein
MPRRLYRYRKIESSEHLERELKAIRENHLWCTRFDKLNDPMEGVFDLTPTAARAPDGPLVSPEVRSVMQQMGVCCFSDTYENDVMWVHYAGEYRGICVKYSTHDLRDGLPNAYAVRVQYDIQIPILRADETPDRQEAAMKALSSKKSDWYYEREWRLLTKAEAIDVPGILKIHGQSPVKGIYFGPRTEPDVIDAFRDALDGVRDDTIKFCSTVVINIDGKKLSNEYRRRLANIKARSHFPGLQPVKLRGATAVAGRRGDTA